MVGYRSPTKRGTFGGHVPAYRIIHTHEWIAHCLPAAVGECACPAHAAAAMGDKTAMRPFAELLWTLVTYATGWRGNV